MRVYTLAYCNDDHKVVDFASYLVNLDSGNVEEAIAPHKAFSEECEKLIANGYKEVRGENVNRGITMVYCRRFVWGCSIRPANRPERISLFMKSTGIRPLQKRD